MGRYLISGLTAFARRFLSGDLLEIQQVDGYSRKATFDRLSRDVVGTVASIRAFDPVADGVTSDNAAIALAEASAFTHIDLSQLTLYAPGYQAEELTKKYFNGTLYVDNVVGVKEQAELTMPEADLQIARPRTKSPILSWTGKNLLWLGTSIPHQGVGVDGYPEMFARALNATVDNKAWAGSHAYYDVDGDPDSIITVKGLSMTQDDVVAGLALYGPTSAYDDDFDVVTKASEMTADFRILAPFNAGTIDVVMLDHNHNDRRQPLGTYDPEGDTISSVTKGATTQITLDDNTMFAVGDAVALEIVGIDKLNNWAGRVQAVAGDVITVNLNSAAYAGAFVSGTARKIDRATFYGAFDFLIRYIKWAAVQANQDVPTIILSGAPSQFTNNTPDNAIYSSARALYNLATWWSLAFFDIGYLYDVKWDQQLVYFEDGVHPLSTEQRQSLANYWVQWAQGGAEKPASPADYLARGGGAPYIDQREAIYSPYYDGFATPSYIVGEFASVFTDDFSGGLGAWTTQGTAPVVMAAPWDAGEDAIYTHSTVGTPISALKKTGLVLDAAFAVEFDLWLPDVVGQAPAGLPRTVDIARFRNPAVHYSLQLTVRANYITLKLVYFTGVGVESYTVPITQVHLEADTKYRIRLEAVKATVDYVGGVVVLLDGERISQYLAINDEAQPLPTEFWIGPQASNTTQTFDAYFGNVEVFAAEAHDFTDRFTGEVTVPEGTMTIVNGIITAVTP